MPDSPIFGSSPSTRFDDGNGRITLAIADMALARSEHGPQRFYSMSAQIRQERNSYYDVLERTQEGTMDVTPCMEWFPGCLGRAIDGVQETLRAMPEKARFKDRIKEVKLNDRQREQSSPTGARFVGRAGRSVDGFGRVWADGRCYPE